MRGLIIGALKGDARSLTTLFRLAELSGQFGDANSAVTQVVVKWGGSPEELPANREINRKEP
jgi:hypothetical protein